MKRPSATTGRAVLPQSRGEKSPWLHYWLEHVSRPAISLKKTPSEPFKGRVLFHTTYSDYSKENVHLFDPLDFLAELAQHICNIQQRAAVAKYRKFKSSLPSYSDTQPAALARVQGSIEV